MTSHPRNDDYLHAWRADTAALPRDALLGQLGAPAGFTATIFATPAEANYPVFVAATADGTLFVSSDGNGSLGRDPNRGRVLRLRDTDGDGVADEVKAFVERLDSPRGLVWVDDRLIVLHPPHVTSFQDADGDGRADDQTGKRLVSDISGRDRTSDSSPGCCRRTPQPCSARIAGR